jgi:hypothetical protein
LLEPGPMSPSRVAEELADGLVAGALLCGLLAVAGHDVVDADTG